MSKLLDLNITILLDENTLEIKYTLNIIVQISKYYTTFINKLWQVEVILKVLKSWQSNVFQSGL